MNEIINPDFKPVKYISLKSLVELCQAAGPKGYLFVLDMMDAYWRVPIHPSQYKYNGLKWNNKLWVFTSLQMGLASAAQIYTKFADAITWMAINRNSDIAFNTGLQCLRHYLDDFFGACTTLEEANQIFNDLLELLQLLGIPTRPDKCSPPSNKFQKILGWAFRQKEMTVGLTDKKRIKYLNDVNKLLKEQFTTRHFLEQVKGRLQNVAQIRWPGKAMLRRLDALIYLPDFSKFKRFGLTPWVNEDLEWWQFVLESPDRCKVTYHEFLKTPDEADRDITTDASTEIGMGGHSKHAAFQIRWEDTKYALVKDHRGVFDITLMELLGSVVAAELFGPDMDGKSVTIYNDNPGAAAAIGSKTPPLYRMDLHFLTVYLCKLAANYNFKFWGVHCTDERMKFADGLSRFKKEKKYQIEPRYQDLSDEATVICDAILTKLLNVPINLPTNYPDISYRLRQKYRVLYDKKYYQKEKLNQQKRLNKLLNEY